MEFERHRLGAAAAPAPTRTETAYHVLVADPVPTNGFAQKLIAFRTYAGGAR